MRRALVLAVVLALLLRAGPALLAWLSPKFAARARVMQRRVDVAGAIGMLAWLTSLVVARAWIEAAIVGVCAVPVVVGGVRALRS